MRNVEIRISDVGMIEVSLSKKQAVVLKKVLSNVELDKLDFEEGIFIFNLYEAL